MITENGGPTQADLSDDLSAPWGERKSWLRFVIAVAPVRQSYDERGRFSCAVNEAVDVVDTVDRLLAERGREYQVGSDEKAVRG